MFTAIPNRTFFRKFSHQKELHDEQSETQQDVINAVHTFMNRLSLEEFHKTTLEKESERMHLCVCANGRYFEKENFYDDSKNKIF